MKGEQHILARDGRRGMTLVEVLLATVVLGLGLTGIMVALSQCMGLMRLSKEYLDAQWVLGLGELQHPIRETNDVEEKVPVPEESLDEFLSDELRGRRYLFSREVDEKEESPDIEEDGLYVVRSKVRWGGVGYSGKKGNEEVVVRLVLEKK